MKLKNQVREINNELAEELITIIHNWRNFKLMMNIYASNEDEEDYNGEFDWSHAKEYWQDRHERLDNHIENLYELLNTENY